jgi:hypothetical protein
MRLVSVLVTCFLAIGCKSGDPTSEFEGLAKRACGCAFDDTACGNKVLADVAAFARSHKTSDLDLKRMISAGESVDKCLLGAGVDKPKLVAALEPMAK